MSQLNSILTKHNITHLPDVITGTTPQGMKEDYYKLWCDLGRQQERAMLQGNYNIVEHLNRERNKLWYSFIMPAETYRKLPRYMQEIYPR